MKENWPKFFCDAIRSVDDDLPLAMKAAGSREGWLQTEVMLYGRRLEPKPKYIYPNYRPIAAKTSKKFDFAAYENDDDEAPLLAVAELKIIAGHFRSAWKCLTGAGEWPGFDGLPPRRKRIVTPWELDRCAAPWGLIPDAKRLLHFKRKNPNCSALLILVLLENVDKDAAVAKRAHAAMDSVRFGREEMTSEPETKNYKIKVWSVSA
jgi:hypothetical protein